MRGMELLPATLLVVIFQLFVNLPESAANKTKKEQLETLLNIENPTYFQRFEINAAVDTLSRDPKYNENEFQFHREIAKGLNSLSSASVLQSVEKVVADIRNGELPKPSELLKDGSERKAPAVGMSPVCGNQTLFILNGLVTNQPWAAVFYDTMGKPPAGMIGGSNRWPGAYEECVNIHVSSESIGGQPGFNGKYCEANVKRKTTPLFPVGSFRMGVCIPDTCGPEDVNLIIQEYLASINRTETVSISCIPEEDGLDTKAVVAIVICSVLGACMAIGTVLDVVYVQMPKWKHEQMMKEQAELNKGAPDDERMPLLSSRKAPVPSLHVCSKLFISFSVYTNGSKLLSTDQPAGSLNCVHGIRFMSMTWVVLGHAISLLRGYSVNNGAYTAKVVKRWSFQAVSNATVSVDSFFLLSGLLVAYLSLKELKAKRGKINWFLFYFHRFWRLTPAYMLVIMVFTCLTPYWGSGPFWPGRNIGDRTKCETVWWKNLLYINNIYESEETCLGVSWYLANDMQFYILSPLIFVPFYFHPIFGCISSGLFLLASVITPGVVERENRFSPASFVQVEPPGPTENSFTYYYIKPWNRMGPYIIGLMAGYVLYRCELKLRINKYLNLFLWMAATGSAMGILYGLYDAANGEPMTIELASFYFAVSRTVWGACVAWVVIACCTGNGGFVNMLLSWKGLIPASRLTYCIYLMHMMLMDVYMMNQHTLFYMSDINVSMFFVGTLVFCYMAGFVASLAFEAPMMGLEKIIFRRGGSSGGGGGGGSGGSGSSGGRGGPKPSVITEPIRAGEKENGIWKHAYANNSSTNITETKLTL